MIDSASEAIIRVWHISTLGDRIWPSVEFVGAAVLIGSIDYTGLTNEILIKTYRIRDKHWYRLIPCLYLTTLLCYDECNYIQPLWVGMDFPGLGLQSSWIFIYRNMWFKYWIAEQLSVVFIWKLICEISILLCLWYVNMITCLNSTHRNHGFLIAFCFQYSYVFSG